LKELQKDITPTNANNEKTPKQLKFDLRESPKFSK
jgi:hypothetical protein